VIVQAAFLVLLAVTGLQAAAGGRDQMKEYYSPDRSIVARVRTVSEQNGANAESNVEFRRRSDGRLIGARSFISKDRRRGLGVVEARWSFDSNFFVFSTLSSGGRYPGVFPTFVFSRNPAQIVLLDAVLKTTVASPEFSLQAPDLLTVVVRDSAAGRSMVERSFRLSDLLRL
jgi:hypothetical protein